MKIKLLFCFALILSGVSFGQPSSVPPRAVTEVDKTLTKQIAQVLKECQTIKPRMTRADLLKIFTTEGGLSTAAHRTFVYRGCPYIKVDVDFRLSDSSQKLAEEKPTDIIARISHPYLAWSVID